MAYSTPMVSNSLRVAKGNCQCRFSTTRTPKLAPIVASRKQRQNPNSPMCKELDRAEEQNVNHVTESKGAPSGAGTKVIFLASGRVETYSRDFDARIRVADLRGRGYEVTKDRDGDYAVSEPTP